MPNALILIAHGSPRAQANEEFLSLVESVAEKVAGQYSLVKGAFLGSTTPDIATAINDAISQGATRINVLPYFLNSGVHVAKDVPSILEQQQQNNPHCTITLLPCFGLDPDIANLIARQVTLSQ
ncbi:CbiX/SirB N-terminal domain-containing protein [Porticoccus sp. W117]|uniref:sirohydrochlorin chelatase n=1 Tax=Porticoccus sp. W117 TaxID=3054777 RepID=UPI002593EFD3|nr:CbiX/SirB N-terminal domain-containing protein [Porticoccus sp. W117]MDM3871284.1 CbiX/SirB N-terminal domain-containing protein [Porticoccus sp. W117]